MQNIKVFLFLWLLTWCFSIIAQVGINNTNPNAVLDVRASSITTPNPNDGILIPSVDEFPVVNPTINQDGMLLFVTGNGSISRGFYYWDFSQNLWIIINSGDNNDDWFQSGTTFKPSNISDNIYTLGNVGINQINPSWPLDVISTSGGRGLSLAMTGTSTLSTYGAISSINTIGDGTHAGFVSRVLDNGNGDHYGLQTLNSGTGSGNHYGQLNQLTGSGQGIQIGVGNIITNTGDNTQYGIRSDLSGPGNGVHYGSYQNLSGTGTGNKIGTRVFIDPNVGGNHYGIYSEALGTNAFAGYFLGVVSFGSSTLNRYQFPISDGNNGESLVTDGSGNLQWQTVLTTSDKLAFKVSPSTNINLTSGLETELIFNQVVFNYGNGVYDPILGEFRFTDSGIYRINASISLDFNGAVTSNAIIIFRVYVNGVLTEEFTDQAGALLNTTFLNTYLFDSLLEMNSGDLVTLSITPIWGGGSPGPILQSNATSFSINRVY